MNTKKKLAAQVAAGLMTVCLLFPSYTQASTRAGDDGSVAQTEATQAKETDSKDTKKLKERIKELEQQLEEQSRRANELMDEIHDLSERQEAIERGDSLTHGYPATSNYLVEPGWNGNTGYTQDAVNAQGDSTMVFSYSPSQLYKIYCKLNYLTDIALKPGEPITFVGGGDTGQWMLDTSTIDGVAHLYLKPIAKGARTNLIVNTTHHSYQILCEEGDWYNPMIKWAYGSEAIMESVAQQKMNAQIYTSTVANTEDLNFNYRISGKASWKPERVFDDGSKTIIQFKKGVKKMPVLFAKEKGHKEVSLVNYQTRNNCIIVARTFDEAELREGKEVVKIKASK